MTGRGARCRRAATGAVSQVALDDSAQLVDWDHEQVVVLVIEQRGPTRPGEDVVDRAFPPVRLVVDPLARRFYEARGFRAIRFTDGADNEEGTPDVRYRWERTTRKSSSPGQVVSTPNVPNYPRSEDRPLTCQGT
jgi:hypothetical protein